MIIAQIEGGLGNQMFRYAMARRLSYVLHTDIKLDISPFEGYKIREFKLNKFHISASIATKADREKFFRNPGNRYVRILFSLFPILGQKGKHYKERYYHFDPDALHLSDDTYISGYFQSERYFKDIKEIIRNELTLKNPKSINQKLLHQIRTTASIGVHLRLGDFVEDPKTNKLHGFYGLDYLQKAVNLISKKIHSPYFYIFSDDIDRVRKNLKLPYQVIYVSGEFSHKDYEDLILMSSCKHNIIVNSTFGWWGAWLNSNKNKIVLTPNKWYQNGPVDTQDLLPNSWIKI